MKKINPDIFVVIVNECHKVFIFGMRYNRSNAPHITMDQIETTFSMTTGKRKRKTYSYLVCMLKSQQKDERKIDLYYP